MLIWGSSSFASWAKEVGRLISRVEVKKMREDRFRFMIDGGGPRGWLSGGEKRRTVLMLV